MDLWKMRLRAASFRGVPFGVTADESEGGRRTVTHEFPQRETPYVEDLGGAPRRARLLPARSGCGIDLILVE